MAVSQALLICVTNRQRSTFERSSTVTGRAALSFVNMGLTLKTILSELTSGLQPRAREIHGYYFHQMNPLSPDGYLQRCPDGTAHAPRDAAPLRAPSCSLRG
jgi:hypothetical protein